MQNKFLYFPNDEWPSAAMLAAEKHGALAGNRLGLSGA